MSANTEYILQTVKQDVNAPEDDAFDSSLVRFINTCFMILKRMGVGPAEGFSITLDGDDQWTDFMENGPTLEAVKTYVSLKAGMVFDPPASSVLMEARKEAIKELEWSLNFEEDRMSDDEEV